MTTIPLGLIGCGLMGRELASAAARWAHLTDLDARPQLVAICDTNRDAQRWFTTNFGTIRQATDDYRQLLANAEVQAVYCALPHHLHEEVYCAAIRAGKHLLGEKPFGIDLAANRAIQAAAAERPDVLVRCSSQFPFFPAVQRMGRMIEAGDFGRIIEVGAGFLHSSDLDPRKPLNWKRIVQFNGAYGCMGDLGMHVCHVPFRAGWTPKNVRAILSNVVPQRPDATGQLVPCETWDNATLFCEAVCPASGQAFPLTLKTHRIAPGEKNTWYLEVLGTQAAARFSTKNPKRLELLQYRGGEQVWQHIDMGHETAFATITGGIFEFGFSDALLQMWAAMFDELARGRPRSRFAGCATLEETALSHRLFTAALTSHQTGTVAAV